MMEQLLDTDFVTVIVFAMLSVTLVMGFIRLVIGPHPADRVIALDLIAVTVVAWIIVYAISSNQAVFLDAAVVMAIINFVSTVTFALYLERYLHD